MLWFSREFRLFQTTGNHRHRTLLQTEAGLSILANLEIRRRDTYFDDRNAALPARSCERSREAVSTLTPRFDDSGTPLKLRSLASLASRPGLDDARVVAVWVTDDRVRNTSLTIECTQLLSRASVECVPFAFSFARKSDDGGETTMTGFRAKSAKRSLISHTFIPTIRMDYAGPIKAGR